MTELAHLARLQEALEIAHREAGHLSRLRGKERDANRVTTLRAISSEVVAEFAALRRGTRAEAVTG